MTVLVDANQIAISHLMVRNKIEAGINVDTIRKSIIRVIGRIAKKHQAEFGEVVLCYDDKNYWRRDIFPFYKKNRKKEREASSVNWDRVFTVLNQIRDEIKTNLPYKVIQVQGAEADDIIASLTIKNYRDGQGEKTLILSADKDFIQLHRFPGVKQYDPIRNRWIENDNPRQYLQEHIIRGDRSDGIPNILTCDDAIVTGKTQKKMSKEKIAALASMDPADFTNYIRLRNWRRNADLIDFTRIPATIKERILSTYHKSKTRPSVNLTYFSENNMADILEEFA